MFYPLKRRRVSRKILEWRAPWKRSRLRTAQKPTDEEMGVPWGLKKYLWRGTFGRGKEYHLRNVYF